MSISGAKEIRRGSVRLSQWRNAIFVLVDLLGYPNLRHSIRTHPKLRNGFGGS